MDRTEAFRTLRLDQSADGHMVEAAYWSLVRRAQARAKTDPEDREIDRLNAAYAALAPDGRGPAQPVQQRAQGTGIDFLDWIADWFARQALLTRERWSGRNPEIAVIGGSVLVLMVLALGEGATAAGVFLCAGIISLAIWAPWRRVPPGE